MVGVRRVRVASAHRPRSGEVWVFVGQDGQLVAHRCLRSRPDLVFQGDANRAPDRPVDPDRLVGRVVSIEVEGEWQVPGASDRVRGLLVLGYRGVRRVLGDRQPAWLRDVRSRRP